MFQCLQLYNTGKKMCFLFFEMEKVNKMFGEFPARSAARVLGERELHRVEVFPATRTIDE